MKMGRGSGVYIFVALVVCLSISTPVTAKSDKNKNENSSTEATATEKTSSDAIEITSPLAATILPTIAIVDGNDDDDADNDADDTIVTTTPSSSTTSAAGDDDKNNEVDPTTESTDSSGDVDQVVTEEPPGDPEVVGYQYTRHPVDFDTEDRVLEGHTFRTYQTCSVLHCATTCMGCAKKGKPCKSFNYNAKNCTCQLNDKNHKNSTLQTKEGWQYFAKGVFTIDNVSIGTALFSKDRVIDIYFAVKLDAKLINENGKNDSEKITIALYF